VYIARAWERALRHHEVTLGFKEPVIGEKREKRKGRLRSE
jgi:hypothetical protein